MAGRWPQAQAIPNKHSQKYFDFPFKTLKESRIFAERKAGDEKGNYMAPDLGRIFGFNSITSALIEYLLFPTKNLLYR